MRYLIKFSYDGIAYCGYQRQAKDNTVQEEIEKALKKLNNNKETILQASSRTDKGVHALGQCAHFDLDIEITKEKVKRALNSSTPKDIHIIEVKEVDSNFHARYDSKGKEYKYYINLGEFNPIERNYVYQYNYKLNIDKMNEAIKYFIGVHDFRSFVTNNKDKENCVREITKATISKLPNKKIVLDFKGTGFMRYQIRNMVGILLKVGQEKIEPIEVKNILERKDRSENGVTAPSNGLYLVKVYY